MTGWQTKLCMMYRHCDSTASVGLLSIINCCLELPVDAKFENCHSFKAAGAQHLKLRQDGSFQDEQRYFKAQFENYEALFEFVKTQKGSSKIIQYKHE